jgi:integrase/recombinase XerD
LVAQGHVLASPVPATAPKRPADFQPYIYSQDELRRLLTATDSYYRCRTQAGLYGPPFRTLLLLLYGAGLRISEAVSLRLGDVDLCERLLTVRESKFYKTRLVPIGPKLTRVLEDSVRRQRPAAPSLPSAPLLVSRNGSGLARNSTERAFRRLCTAAGVSRPGPARCQPRLHDLRHTFAVHRVLAWYKAGEDVQRLLPQLATYLGHRDLVSTQRYLTMTPEVLREAGKRFASYAFGGGDE